MTVTTVDKSDHQLTAMTVESILQTVQHNNAMRGFTCNASERGFCIVFTGKTTV